MSSEWLEEARYKLQDRDLNRRDDHHLAHYDQEWSLRPEGLYIRQQLIARGINRAVHNLIHRECAPVPVPGVHTLQRVANRLTPGLDLFDAVDDYTRLVEQSNRHPKIKPIEISLNNLSIEALRAQLPYVRDGLGRRAA